MGMFGSIGSIAGNFFAPGIGGQIGGMIGGALDGKGAVKGAQGMQGDVRAMSEAQYQRALPWDASGEFGSIKYDRSGKAVSSELSKPWQSQLDRLLGRATTTGEQISKYSADPMVAQQQLYEQQQALFRPQQERDILSLEARLQAQGKGGSTGGAGEMRALREAQYMKDLAREYGAFDRSMDMGTTLRDWEKGDIRQATDIGKLPTTYQSLATSGGISADPYAEYKVKGLKGASKAEGMTQDKYGNLVESVTGGLFTGTSTPFKSGGFSGSVRTPGLFGGGSYVPTKMVGGFPVPQ